MVVGSLVPSVPLARPSSHSTPVHPTSKGSWQWLGGAVVVGFTWLGQPLLVVVVLPPTIHPMSSGLQGWGQVLGRSFPAIGRWVVPVVWARFLGCRLLGVFVVFHPPCEQ